MLNREAILKAQDLKTVDVKVPEWGGVVRIRTMTGMARQEYYRTTSAGKDSAPKHVMEALVVACAVDEAGNQLFTTGDLKELSNKSAKALNRVFEAAADLNGLTQKAVDDIAGE